MGLMGWQPSVAAWDEWEADPKAAKRGCLRRRKLLPDTGKWSWWRMIETIFGHNIWKLIYYILPLQHKYLTFTL